MHKQPTPFDSFHRWDQSHPVKLTKIHCTIKDPRNKTELTVAEISGDIVSVVRNKGQGVQGWT